MIRVTDRITIDDSELDGETSSARPVRAGRTSTSSRPRCSCASTCARSPSLPNDVARAADAARRQPPHQGRRLVITAQSHRTQERNRQDARDRLIELIRQAAVVRRQAPADQADQGVAREAASKSKKRRGNIKGLRRREAVDSNSGARIAADRSRHRGVLDALDSRRLESRIRHARPPAQRSHRQPHRRRRGGRAACERGQGAGRERARRRRHQDRDRHRRRRPPPDPRHRRRRRHAARRSRARGRAPRHLEARRRRPARHQARSASAARRCRRSASVARLVDHHAPRRASRMPGRSRSTAARNPT